MDKLECQKTKKEICPKCKEFINIYDTINEKIKEILIGIKDQIEMINNSNNITIDKIKNQLTNIMIVIDNMLQQIKKIDVNDNNKIKKRDDNIITGIIDINEKEINKIILLCKSNQQIDVFINDKKINIIKNNNNEYMYEFNEKGKHAIKYQFKNNITNLNKFFENCKEIISLDLSKFNTSKVTEMQICLMVVRNKEK